MLFFQETSKDIIKNLPTCERTPYQVFFPSLHPSLFIFSIGILIKHLVSARFSVCSQAEFYSDHSGPDREWLMGWRRIKTTRVCRIHPQGIMTVGAKIKVVPLVSCLRSRRPPAAILWTSCTTLWLRWWELKTRPSATRATYWYQTVTHWIRTGLLVVLITLCLFWLSGSKQRCFSSEGGRHQSSVDYTVSDCVRLKYCYRNKMCFLVWIQQLQLPWSFDGAFVSFRKYRVLRGLVYICCKCTKLPQESLDLLKQTWQETLSHEYEHFWSRWKYFNKFIKRWIIC